MLLNNKTKNGKWHFFQGNNDLYNALYLLGAAALTTHAVNVVDENSSAFLRRMVTVAVPVDV